MLQSTHGDNQGIYGHSISGEFCTNNMDGFHAVPKKKNFLSLKGHLHKSVNTVVASYVSSRISCCQVPYVLNEIWSLQSCERL